MTTLLRIGAFLLSWNRETYNGIAIERLCTRMTCFAATISKPYFTQYYKTMLIFTRIRSRWILMCSPILMTKAALVILWWSAVKTASVWTIYFIGKITMYQSPSSNVCLKMLQNTKNKSIFACGALVIFHRRTSLRDTKSFVPETTSCFPCAHFARHRIGAN